MNLPIQAKPVSRHITALATSGEGVNPSVCVGGSVNGRQVCVNLPVLGRKCVTSPVSLPIGASVSACTCNHWGVPTGAKLTVSAAGRTIFSKSIGWC
jgi:hypothetical protein